MPKYAPLQLTLYDPETDEIVQDLSRVFVPTGLLTEVVGLFEDIDLDHPEGLLKQKDKVEMLYPIVAEVFGNKISAEDVKRGTDLIEVFALVKAVYTRAAAAFGELGVDADKPNPTLPGQTRRRHK